MPIELRHRRYYAYLDVPVDVRRKLNRRVFRQTLQTDSRSVAQRRSAPLIAQWKSEIARAREEPDHNDALYWRNALQNAKTPENRLLVETLLEEHVWEQGLDNSDPEARQFYGIAFGNQIATDEHLDEWIASLQVKQKTTKMRRSTIERLASKFPILQDISRKEVRRWVTELMDEVKPSTVQRMLTDCRTFWTYLQTIEVVPEDSAPFDRLGLKVKRSSWLPYTPEEAMRLLKAAEGDTQLSDLIRMAMYTGARREELCGLKKEHVHEDYFEIVDAKTTAGIRDVPIHNELAPTIERLIDDSTDDFVISGLKANKNGSRGDALGKKFSRLKRSLNFGDRYAFHSFRGTVITMLERAGVPEGTVQDIVGHERSTLTGSIYSGKSTLDMRRDALSKLVYPN